MSGFWTGNREQLRGLYFEMTAEAALVARDVRRRITCTFLLLTLLPVVICGVKYLDFTWKHLRAGAASGYYYAGITDLNGYESAIREDASASDDYRMWLSTAAFGAVTSLVSGALILLALPKAAMRRARRRGEIIVPTVRQKEVLSSLIAEVEFVIERRLEIVIWRSKDVHAISPSVIARRGSSDLIVPSQLFVLADPKNPRGDPEAVKAMIAHEIGHVLQGDADLWSMAVAFSGSVLVAISIATIAIIVGTAAFGASIPYIGLVLFAWQMISSLRQRVAAARRESEAMADLCAVVFTEEYALARALKTLVRASNPGAVHPELDERIAQAEGFARRALGQAVVGE